MASLFEINAALAAAWDAAVDPETGEINEEGLAAINALELDRDTKIENIGCWVKNLKSDAAALKEEAKAMTERAARAAKKAESLQHYLEAVLAGQKFQTPKVAISWRKSVSVEVDEAEVPDLPEQFKRTEVKVSPDKTAIKDALKAGEIIEGCRLVEKNNISIK